MTRATINDVAREAGVSKKTVSRVLNKEPNVSIDTRRRVTIAMEELNYKPSRHARGLAGTQSFLIGLIYDNPNKSYISDIQEGCLESCNAQGYHLLIQPLNHDATECDNDIKQLINDSQLDGLILTPPFSDQDGVLALISELNIPFVRIGGTYNDHRASYVTANDKEVSRQIIDYLIHLGHQRIGFIKGHDDHQSSALRYQGYLQAFEDNNLIVDETLIGKGDFEFNKAESAAREMLTLNNPPTAIFASNDQMAAAVLKVASQMNISVPHEMSVCGFDDSPISNHIWPSITTISQPFTAIASMACTDLIEEIKTKNRADDKTLLCDLLIRASTAPVNPKVTKHV